MPRIRRGINIVITSEEQDVCRLTGGSRLKDMVCGSLVATEQFRLAINSHSACQSVCLWSSCILSRLRSARLWKKFRMRSYGIVVR